MKNYAPPAEVNCTLDKLMAVPLAQKCYREVFAGVGDFDPYHTPKLLILIRKLTDTCLQAGNALLSYRNGLESNAKQTLKDYLGGSKSQTG